VRFLFVAVVAWDARRVRSVWWRVDEANAVAVSVILTRVRACAQVKRVCDAMA
jgi:hypothetical protein